MIDRWSLHHHIYGSINVLSHTSVQKLLLWSQHALISGFVNALCTGETAQNGCRCLSPPAVHILTGHVLHFDICGTKTNIKKVYFKLQLTSSVLFHILWICFYYLFIYFIVLFIIYILQTITSDSLEVFVLPNFHFLILYSSTTSCMSVITLVAGYLADYTLPGDRAAHFLNECILSAVRFDNQKNVEYQTPIICHPTVYCKYVYIITITCTFDT